MCGSLCKCFSFLIRSLMMMCPLSTMTSHPLKYLWMKIHPKVKLHTPSCFYPTNMTKPYWCFPLQTGTTVASFKAYGRKSEAIHYSVAGGDLGGHFDVDQVSGNVFVNSSLDYETVKRYELWVSAFYSTKPLYSVAKVSWKTSLFMVSRFLLLLLRLNFLMLFPWCP